MGAKRYTELTVWTLTSDVRERVWTIADRLTRPEDLWLRQQLRRAANSACSAVREGFSRYQPRDFARFLRISSGSLEEIGNHCDEPEVARLTPADELEGLLVAIKRALGAQTRLIAYLQHAKAPKVCRPGSRRNGQNHEP